MELFDRLASGPWIALGESEADFKNRVQRDLEQPDEAETIATADEAERGARSLVGSRDYQPFRIYARGEKRPFNLGGGDPVVLGALRWAPIAEDGMVTMSAEALRDLCNHVYREGWRLGEQSGLAEAGLTPKGLTDEP